MYRIVNAPIKSRITTRWAAPLCWLITLLLLTATASAQLVQPAPWQIAQASSQLKTITSEAPKGPWRGYLETLAKRTNKTVAEQQEVWRAVQLNQSMDEQTTKQLANRSFVHVVVPPLSSLMRLPDAFPIDGQTGAPVRVVLAQNEYEPGSFVIFSFEDSANVTLKTSDLKSTAGDVLPASQLDLTVVKVWYQNGNGWYSYFSDVGLQLVPELLLHDENLIEVDTQAVANYARVTRGKDAKKVWISAPRGLDPWFDPHAHPDFEDAPTLQPVRLRQGEFKQFVLTIHSTKTTPPGIYRGSIDVTVPGKAAVNIPVEVRVLPFELPAPKTNFDQDKDFLVRLFSASPSRLVQGRNHPLPTDDKAFLPMLKNMANHNLLNVSPFQRVTEPPADGMKQIALAREAGLSLKPMIAGNISWVGSHDGTPFNFDELMAVRRNARTWANFYKEALGHTDAYLSYGDEPRAAWVLKARMLWRVVQEEGLRTVLAGHVKNLTKATYILDMNTMASQPDDADLAKWWRDNGHGYTAFYAIQHNGSENPDFVRKQHGMLTYLANFSMVHNYEFAYGPWNDLAQNLYKPMVLAYPTHNGFVDTLAWEGFREGIDDIRYATHLRVLATQAIDTGKLDLIYKGRQARLWLSSLEARSADMQAVRLEMIDKILNLQDMLSAK